MMKGWAGDDAWDDNGNDNGDEDDDDYSWEAVGLVGWTGGYRLLHLQPPSQLPTQVPQCNNRAPWGTISHLGDFLENNLELILFEGEHTDGAGGSFRRGQNGKNNIGLAWAPRQGILRTVNNNRTLRHGWNLGPAFSLWWSVGCLWLKVFKNLVGEVALEGEESFRQDERPHHDEHQDDQDDQDDQDNHNDHNGRLHHLHGDEITL